MFYPYLVRYSHAKFVKKYPGFLAGLYDACYTIEVHRFFPEVPQFENSRHHPKP